MSTATIIDTFQLACDVLREHEHRINGLSVLVAVLLVWNVGITGWIFLQKDGKLK